jgi:hypothetical protein
MRPDQAVPLADRIRARIVVTSAGCWEWQGCRDGNGYGRISVGSRADGTRRTTYAHRVAYGAFVAPVPDDLVLDHLCRNPPCCNPEHLEAVTTRENTVVRGVGGVADQARQTHCKRDHPFDAENTYRDRHGKRYCRACHKLREQGKI